MACLGIVLFFFAVRLAVEAYLGWPTYYTEKSRAHFGRPSFRAWSDKDGIHIESGPNPDHATRCQNYFQDRGSRVPDFLFIAFLEAFWIGCLTYIVLWIFS